MWRGHAAQCKRAGYVRDGGGKVVGHAGEVFVARLGRLLLERVQVLVLALEVFLDEVERLAVLAGFMRTTVSRASTLAGEQK